MAGKYNIGFTLAEVLITLGIIGVVAAYTIPILMHSINDAQFKSLFKKEYSVATNAFKQAASENGGSLAGYSSYSGDGVPERSNDMRNIIMPYVKYVKSCDAAQIANCSPVSIYKTYDNQPFPASWTWGRNPAAYSFDSAILLNDGSIWRFYANYDAMGTCTSDWISGRQNCCGMIKIDTNGAKPPNQAGYDLFELYVASDGTVIPMGTSNDKFKASYSTQIGYYPRSLYMLDIN